VRVAAVSSRTLLLVIPRAGTRTVPPHSYAGFFVEGHHRPDSNLLERGPHGDFKPPSTPSILVPILVSSVRSVRDPKPNSGWETPE